MSAGPSGFGIDTTEFERERDVFDMCRWINEKLADMEKHPEFDSLYFERKGTNVKKFIEEAIPVAALGLYIYKPADAVTLKCLTGNQGYDATLRVEGFNNFSIRVEVTTTETDDSVMRRQSLAWHGFTWSSGSIEREKGKSKGDRKIIQEPEMVEYFEEEEHWTNRAFEALLDKLQYDAYGPETAILVRLDTHRSVSLDSRADLMRKTENHLGSATAKVYGVYYFYARDFIVDGVRTTDL